MDSPSTFPPAEDGTHGRKTLPHKLPNVMDGTGDYLRILYWLVRSPRTGVVQRVLYDISLDFRNLPNLESAIYKSKGSNVTID